MATSQDRRPNPDELLRRIQAEERRERRGRLKVFLGYASRVGKTFRMFDEGRRRKQRGEDVVVGVVQRPTTPEVEPILARLEVIPAMVEKDAGETYSVIDVAAILKRQPQVCVIDQLAYRNPPGSRNPERWQDVEELLEHGINVICAVNLQHIREMQDSVERITGKRAAHSVPHAFLQEADEIEVVDAPPEALLGRGASAGMPGPRQLAELRELALLLAADVVDRQLQEYLLAHGIAARWGTQERILVCLTPRSNAAEMLESGRRNALRFHGALLAAYVEQPGLRPADREKLEGHIAKARELGAEIYTLRGSDFVRTILEFAGEQRVTQLFLGHTIRDKKQRWLARGPIDRLIDAAEDFDVRLFPHREAE